MIIVNDVVYLSLVYTGDKPSCPVPGLDKVSCLVPKQDKQIWFTRGKSLLILSRLNCLISLVK